MMIRIRKTLRFFPPRVISSVPPQLTSTHQAKSSSQRGEPQP